MTRLEILHRNTNAVLFAAEAATLREVVEQARIQHIDLDYADLHDGDLRGAYLKGLSLRGAYLDGTDLRDADLRGAQLQDADLFDADLSRADLAGANLNGVTGLRHVKLHGTRLHDTDLRSFRTDFWDVLLRAPAEVPALRAALCDGQVDGNLYHGECCCLIGTLAKVRGCTISCLGNGIQPNSARPAEQWFIAIKAGDTPETSPIVALTLEWLDEFTALLSMSASLWAPRA